MMNEEDGFLRAMLASPEDVPVRLVYADWLEERGDRRAEYLRLGARLAAVPPGHETTRAAWRRMVELRTHLPPAWLALLGDYRATSSRPGPARVELAANALGRPVRYVDEDGYERDIVAAAKNALTEELAYVECRSQRRGGYLDINFHLRVRDHSGREAAWEVESYNPFFGCRVRFLEWYGHTALLIYREKHRTYVCRFGLGSTAVFKDIEDHWVLDGRHLGYWGYMDKEVRRVAIPSLLELSTLSADEAAEWNLLPEKSW
jgi:uncharacterized protein (TIGR02996 family)